MPQSFEINGAPLELLDVGELALIHSNYKPLDTWLIDKFFPQRRSFTQKTVPIAELDIQSDIAPLVSPSVAGKAFDPRTAIAVEFVTPAYLKPKNTVSPATAWDTALLARLRDAGIISTTANLSVAEQYMIAQIETMKRNRDSIDNRKVLMAAELIATGQIVLESDDYKRNVVSYGRDSALTYSPAIAWDQSGATPVDDIEEMIQIMIDNNGGEPSYAVMRGKVYNALSNDAAFKAKFVTPYAGISVPYRPEFTASGVAKFKGYMGSIEIWVYDAFYRMEGTTKYFLPADYFGLIADDKGYVTQCQIQNIKANGMAMDYFETQWYSDDPSAIVLLTESSPLIVPSNKNGVCGGTGFVTLT